MRLDCIRRPQRLEDFANACSMDAKGRYGFEQRAYPQADYVRAAAQTLRDTSIKPLLEQGLRGAELGQALEQQRLRALKAFKSAQ